MKKLLVVFIGSSKKEQKYKYEVDMIKLGRRHIFNFDHHKEARERKLSNVNNKNNKDV